MMNATGLKYYNLCGCGGSYNSEVGGHTGRRLLSLH